MRCALLLLLLDMVECFDGLNGDDVVRGGEGLHGVKKSLDCRRS